MLLKVLLIQILFFISSSSLANELDFSKTKIIKLEEGWNFYWNELVEFPSKATTEPRNVKLPHDWHIKEDLPNFGYASYIKTIKSLDAGSYEIGLDRAGSSIRISVYVDDSRIAFSESGKVARTSEAFTASRKPTRLAFNLAQASDVSIVIQVANFSTFHSGSYYIPKIGLDNELSHSALTNRMIALFCMGLVFSTGFYSLMMWLKRRQDYSPFFLSLTCISAFLRLPARSPYVLEIIPDSYYEWILRLDYLTIPMGVFCFTAFIIASFSEKESKRTLVILMSSMSIGIIFSIFSDLFLVTQSLATLQKLALFILSYAMIVLVSACRRREPGSIAFCLASVLLVGSVGSEIYIESYHPLVSVLTPVAFCFFILVQAHFIASRAAHAHKISIELAEQLRKQEINRTAFFHNTSHELRTPLNGIIGFLELILKGRYGSLDDNLSEKLHKIHRLASSLKNQVNLILEIARSQHGAMELKVQVFSMFDLLEESEDLMQALKTKYTNCDFRIETRLDNNELQQTLKQDYEKLITILRNLIGNAFKFSDAKRSNMVTLSINSDPAKRILDLSVSDTGIGIPKEYQEDIFMEFKQVESQASRNYEGTGLGLSLVKKICDFLGAELKLESEENKGTTVSICVRTLQDSEAISLEKTKSVHFNKEVKPIIEKEPTFVEKRSQKILIVDDHEANCELLYDVLSEQGFSVKISHSGKSCLQLLTEWIPDLILLDVMMPGMSGEEVLEYLKKAEAYQDIPVILITARDGEADRLRGLKIGADDYISKPIIIEELSLRIRNMLTRLNLRDLQNQIENREQSLIVGELIAELSPEFANIGHSEKVENKQLLEKIKLLWESLRIPSALKVQHFTSSLEMQEFQRRLEILNASLPKDSKILSRLATLIASSQSSDMDLDFIWSEIQHYSKEELIQLEALIQFSRCYFKVQENNHTALQMLIEVSANEEIAVDLEQGLKITSKLISHKLFEYDLSLSWHIDKAQYIAMKRNHLHLILMHHVLLMIHRFDHELGELKIDQIECQKPNFICLEIKASGKLKPQHQNKHSLVAENLKARYKIVVEDKEESLTISLPRLARGEHKSVA